MDSLIQTFEERLQEIDAYLTLLDAFERQLREGPPKIGGETITAQQQKILYSSVYLQLYNLVEATANWCIDAVSVASASARWKPIDLIAEVRREWVRVTARTHSDLNVENRLDTTVAFCDRVLQISHLSNWSIEKGGGGNWDDLALAAITARLGFELFVSQPVLTGIKKHIREERGALVLVRFLRNQLAHGSLSFAECGDGVTVADLRDIKDRTALYLREVVAAFRDYIDGYNF